MYCRARVEGRHSPLCATAARSTDRSEGVSRRRRDPERVPSRRGRRLVDPSARAADDATPFDVSRAVVQPSFRSVPWKADVDVDDTVSPFRRRESVRSCACAAETAAGVRQREQRLSLRPGRGHHEQPPDRVGARPARRVRIQGSASPPPRAGDGALLQGTRDYNVGEPPDPSTLEAAENLSIVLPEAFEASAFDYERDIVLFDLILVMDKYTAADVLREVSVYDTVQKETRYSRKVRRLGEFHPQLKGREEADGQDIDDPLYGNCGGETARVRPALPAPRILNERWLSRWRSRGWQG